MFDGDVAHGMWWKASLSSSYAVLGLIWIFPISWLAKRHGKHVTLAISFVLVLLGAVGMMGAMFAAAAVIVSWLTAFNVINVHNNFVRSMLRILLALTEPVFRPIRKVTPALGGLDLSPLIVLVLIWFLQYTIRYLSYTYGI